MMFFFFLFYYYYCGGDKLEIYSLNRTCSRIGFCYCDVFEHNKWQYRIPFIKFSECGKKKNFPGLFEHIVNCGTQHRMGAGCTLYNENWIVDV